MRQDADNIWREVQQSEVRLAQLQAIKKRLGIDKPRCGYTKHTNGEPCRMPLEPGQRHCRTHDVGPKTAEGRQRCREAQLRRWANWHQETGRTKGDWRQLAPSRITRQQRSAQITSG